MFKILIVEDDRDLNRSVCSFLNNSGYEAVGCLDAESAYDEMYKTTFDCTSVWLMRANLSLPSLTKKKRIGTAHTPLVT